MNQLEQIKKFTTVVADTGDFESIRQFAPTDATTNPSLIYAATQKENYAHFLDEVLTDRKNSGLRLPWSALALLSPTMAYALRLAATLLRDR